MALNKKERGMSIGVGVTIGVVMSWGLFNYWKQARDKFEENLPGKYDSNVTTLGKPMSRVPPAEIQRLYPQGLVVYHLTDANASTTLPGSKEADHVWILTVKSGRYQYLRVEQTPSEDANASPVMNLYRGAEIFVWTESGISEDELNETLPDNKYRILGENTRLGCYLVQVRDNSPEGLPTALRDLPKRSGVAKAAPCPIN